MIKVVAFNGSPRANGNTFLLLNVVLNELKQTGIETKLIQLGTKPLQGCISCRKCMDTRNQKCALPRDLISECTDEMIQADGILLGSPVYCAGMTSSLKALIDRSVLVAKANDDLFKRKVGASVIAVRRAGAVATFDSINHFFLISQMIVPGSSYWNLGQGLQQGDVEKDEEGLRTMVNLGKNMAWVLHNIHGK